MVGGKAKPVRMNQASQDEWVSNYEAWQLKITRFAVRQIGGLVGWLNILRLTSFISYLATHLVDPLLAWVTGMTQLEYMHMLLCMLVLHGCAYANEFQWVQQCDCACC